MYALPIADLQQLTRLPPHQELMIAGKLVEIKNGMDVLFVSHQWLSMQHPDPESKSTQMPSAHSFPVGGWRTGRWERQDTAAHAPRQGAQIKKMVKS
jgi:hypothetical protein